MTDLFAHVLHHLEGTETKIQNCGTKTGMVSGSVTSFGPDRWIERAALGRLMAIDTLAVILSAVRTRFDLEQERCIVDGWSVELRSAVCSGEIQARDPVTLLALETLPDGWDWLISDADADKFVAARGMEWKVSEQVRLHLEESRKSAPAPNPEKLQPTLTVDAHGGAMTDTALLDAPQPLTTATIAECFAGLGWKTAEAWKKPLGDVPKWLASCLVQQGQRGVRERLWNPVQIGAALVAHKRLNANNIRARFQRMHLLMPWFDAWKTYEADYLDTQ